MEDDLQTPAVVPQTETPPVTPPAVETPPAAKETEPKPAPGDPLLNPRVIAEMKRREALAQEQGRKQAELEAKQAAERAAMGEADRLRAEKADEERKAQEATARLTATEVERDIAITLVKSKVQLTDPSSMKFLQFQVQQAIAEQPGLSTDTAVAQVLAAHPYIHQAQINGVVIPASAVPPEQAPVPSTVVAQPTPVTQQPAVKVPQKVSVMDMTPDEYRKYKAQRGIA